MGFDKCNVEAVLTKIKLSEAPEENKRLLMDFYYEKLASGLKPNSLAAYLKVLSRLLVFRQKPFREFSQSELVEFFTGLRPLPCNVRAKDGKVYTKLATEYAPYSISAMKINVKIFWKWMFRGDRKADRDEHGNPMAVSWMSGSRRKLKCLFPKEPLTREEVQAMIKSVRSVRTKAVIAVLFESGQRQGEFLGMKMSGIKFYDDYCEFVCSGKTGERPVILVKSYPYFRKWLEERELIKGILEEHKDFVWITTTKSFAGTVPRRMKLGALTNAIKYAAIRAGITKRVWVHGMRHSSATDFFKQGYNETEARLKYGWSKDSNMPSVYTHYKHDELRDKILIRSGKKTGESRFDANSLTLKECPFCSTENPGDGEYCYKCGKPLNIKQLKALEHQAQATEVLQQIIRQELEKKGVSLDEITRILAAKSQ